MSNWVSCRFLNISDMETFKTVAVNPRTGDIDFGILLSMPDTLDIVSSQSKELPDGFTFPEITEETQLDCFIQECVDKEISVNQALGHWNMRKHNAHDWYEWRIAHWGTKWNASNCILEDGDMPEFNTPGAVPEAWLKELGKHLDFSLAYADDDMGANCGLISMDDGEYSHKKPDSRPEAIAFAYYARYDGCAQEIMEEESEYNDDFDYQDAMQNFGQYIAKWF